MTISSLSFQKSLSKEFESYQNRVRNLIGHRHHAEDGNYKELILMNFLKKFLPPTLKVGTGFVKSNSNKDNPVSKQIDVIIYKSCYPIYFNEGDFIIVPPESVVGIIEVKTSQDITQISHTIKKANLISKVVPQEIFNGIFVYETSHKFDLPTKLLKDTLLESLTMSNSVNHIAINQNPNTQKTIFIKKWADSYKCYNLNELSTGYFFSNLLEYTSEHVAKSMKLHLYPAVKGKGEYLNWEIPSYNL